MYDFIFQEQWWVETIIAAVITGALSFVAAYLAYATKVEMYLEKIEDSNARMDRQNRSILDKVESQTKLLSSEHKDLSKEHRDLSKEHSELKREIYKVIANQEVEKTVREAYGKVIPEGDTFNHMADAIYMHSVQLQQEVNTLKNQNAQLENQNRDLKQQIIALKEQLLSKEQHSEKNEYDEILDNMDLSPDSHDEEEWER